MFIDRRYNIRSRMTTICMIVFFLTNISYLPYFADKGLTSFLSYPAWIFLLIVVVASKSLYLNKNDKGLIIVIMTVFILLTLFSMITGRNYFSSLLTRCIIIAIFVHFLGEMVAKSGKIFNQEYYLLIAYIVGALVINIVIYYMYLRGQDISSSIYSYTSKNETAFINVTSIIFLLYCDKVSINRDTKLKTNFRIFLIVIFLLLIFLMRCRSMMLAAVLVLGMYMFQRNSSKGIKFIIFFAMVLFFIAMQNDQFYDTVINGILFSGRERTNLDSLSSGRITQINDAYIKFQDSFFLGTGDTKTVDCFYISVLMQYGVVVGGIFLCLACTPCIDGILLYKRTKEPLGLVLILCSVSYMVGGLFEENAPFGPGVRCYMMWFLYGYLKMRPMYIEVEKYENN